MDETNRGDTAIEFLKGGCNCAQCVLMAFGEAEASKLCGGVSRGFGFGGFCGALVGAAMALGRDEYGVKAKELALLSDFWGEYGTFDCAAIRQKTDNDCEYVIRRIATLTEKYAD